MKTIVLPILVCLAASSLSTGLRAAPPGSSSLDDKLFGDSQNQLPDAAVRKPSSQDEPAATDGTDLAPLDQRLRNQLGEAAIAEDAHPLIAIASQMRDVQARLATRPADPETATLQKQIVSQLEQLLRDARSQASASGEASRQAPPADDQPPGASPAEQPGGSDRTPRQGPARQSTDKPGNDTEAAGGSPEQDARHVMERLWNQLPARQREQLLQLAPERFLPKYESQIEEYFRRLSEQQP